MNLTCLLNNNNKVYTEKNYDFSHFICFLNNFVRTWTKQIERDEFNEPTGYSTISRNCRDVKTTATLLMVWSEQYDLLTISVKNKKCDLATFHIRTSDGQEFKYSNSEYNNKAVAYITDYDLLVKFKRGVPMKVSCHCYNKEEPYEQHYLFNVTTSGFKSLWEEIKK